MDVINGMRAFVAVAQSGSFTVAAKRLGYSRALVSKYVGQLEARLSVRLLNRTTRRVTLTEAGQNYLARATDLLEDFDALEVEAQRGQEVVSGHLKISAPETYAKMFFPKMLEVFLARYPRVSVDLLVSDRFVNLVEEGFDVAVRIGALEESSLVARRVGQMHPVICASPDYLTKFGTPTRPTELENHTCLLDGNMRGGDRWPFQIDGKLVRMPVHGRLRMSSADIMREMVLRGSGIGLCLSFLVERDLEEGKLVRLFGDFETDGMGIHAVYPHRQHLPAKVRAFVDHLAESAP